MATFSLADFLKEARRRRVFRFAVIYIVGAWITLQVADLAFPGLGIPESAIRYVWISVILGMPGDRVASLIKQLDPTMAPVRFHVDVQPDGRSFRPL